MKFALIIFVAGIMLGTAINPIIQQCPDCVCSECQNTLECKPVPDMRTRIERIEVCTPEEIMTECTLMIENAQVLGEMLN